MVSGLLKALPLTVALAVALGALLMAGAGDSAPAQATVAIRYSHFLPAEITVPAGVPVTITLRNDDPIDHEWIVGTAEVHERHRTGTEPFHATVPTEVTVPAFSARVTTVTFEEPGVYLYVCHLPGHEAYGMVGGLRVTERRPRPGSGSSDALTVW
ncbi:MAG: cupredoxin domain-containing protein [Dehalococcoidia bacterium]